MRRAPGEGRSSGSRSTAAVPGLRYVTDAQPGFRRRRAGRGFVYLDENGRRIRAARKLERIRALAVPPAWTDVWICPFENGHLLATGKDAKGRKQYRYHPRWRSVRDEAKFDRLEEFGEALPVLRRRVRRDMAATGLPKSKVVAAVVALLDGCFARIGNEEYARTNGSFGLTTLRNRHARFDGSQLRLRYRGKGGKEHEVCIDDRRVVDIVRRCQAIPGQELFRYVDGDGGTSSIGSADVNDYLREAAQQEITAKDFRTWAGTVAAARLLRREPERSERARQKVILGAIDEVASDLGNTRAISRRCYVHPAVIEGYTDGSLARAWATRGDSGPRASRGLSADERFVLAYLRRRSKRTRQTRAA